MVLNMKTGNGKDESRTGRDEQRRKYSKMDKRVKDKLVRSPRENGGGLGCPKRSSLKNWKGRGKREDTGKDGKRKQKEIFK